MKNKIIVSIYSHDYTMLADEDEGYVRQIGAFVDTELRNTMAGGRLSIADGAVLTAVNITDKLFQEQASCENLRRQLKSEIEASAKLKSELSEAKREIFKLQSRK